MDSLINYESYTYSVDKNNVLKERCLLQTNGAMIGSYFCQYFCINSERKGSINLLPQFDPEDVLCSNIKGATGK